MKKDEEYQKKRVKIMNNINYFVEDYSLSFEFLGMTNNQSNCSSHFEGVLVNHLKAAIISEGKYHINHHIVNDCLNIKKMDLYIYMCIYIYIYRKRFKRER